MTTGHEEPDPMLRDALRLTDSLESWIGGDIGLATNHEGLRVLALIARSLQGGAGTATGTRGLAEDADPE